ncbi:MAG: glycosyltransferase, partial [Chloroflexota bacterium]|nr:glycosyltransferase [Chloroflexota bacterium]
RAQLGYSPEDTVVLYFGSPAPLRGLHTLVRALGRARQTDPSLKLLILSRRRADELVAADAELREVLDASDVKDHVQVVSGFLPTFALVRHVASSDIVALPFELVPSDAPLSLLEARALAKPVVTTRVGCLPELVAGGPHYLAEPGDPHSLAQGLIHATKEVQEGRRTQGERAGNDRARHPIRSWQQMGEEWSQFVQAV